MPCRLASIQAKHWKTVVLITLIPTQKVSFPLPVLALIFVFKTIVLKDLEWFCFPRTSLSEELWQRVIPTDHLQGPVRAILQYMCKAWHTSDTW
eukprot:4925568-Amphidinium_carterae.1